MRRFPQRMLLTEMGEIGVVETEFPESLRKPVVMCPLHHAMMLNFALYNCHVGTMSEIRMLGGTGKCVHDQIHLSLDASPRQK